MEIFPTYFFFSIQWEQLHLEMFAGQNLPHRELNNKSEIQTSHIFPFERNANNKVSKWSFNFFQGNKLYERIKCKTKLLQAINVLKPLTLNDWSDTSNKSH